MTLDVAASGETLSIGIAAAGSRALAGAGDRGAQPLTGQEQSTAGEPQNAENHRYTVVLGGVGPDGHSVGLSLLHTALQANGYRTVYLGTHNDLEGFFQAAEAADAVLISSLDGHALRYVRDFPEIRLKHQSSHPLWYIGGNLHIGEDDTATAFLELGFDRVFTKFVDLAVVLDTLRADLRGLVPVSAGQAGSASPALWQPTAVLAAADRRQARGPRRRPRRDPLADRADVLGQWRTGTAAGNLDDNARFLARQPSFPATQRAAREPLLQPRCGVALPADQERLMLSLRRSGADVLSYQVDSLTRNNDYLAAEQAIRQTTPGGPSALNGFPVVNHGVHTLRSIGEKLDMPLQTRHSARDPRLLAEISYAGGVTSFEGGPICYNIPYHRDLPLRVSIARWQYVDRLTALYRDRYGITLDREFFGVLTATLVPPCLAIAVDVIEMLLAVEQGVKSVSLGYAEQGHRTQDIAAIRALRAVAEQVLRERRHDDVEVFAVFHQYMAAFPNDRGLSAQLIRASARTAMLSGPTRVLVKTTAEGSAIPTLVQNRDGMSNVQRGLHDAAAGPAEAEIAAEEALIRAEAECILDSVLRSGMGDLAEGVARSFELGWLDIPFAPSLHNRGKVTTTRDMTGAVRFLSIGDLQLSKDLRDFHEERTAERRKAEGTRKGQDYLILQRDVLRVPRGEYERWPLDA